MSRVYEHHKKNSIWYVDENQMEYLSYCSDPRHAPAAGRGKAKWMKWFFYLYYPAHLILLGILRVMIYGDINLTV